MKKVLLAIFLITVCFRISEASSLDSVKVFNLVNEVRKEFAPDKRTAFFKATIKSYSPLVIDIESTEEKAILALKARFQQESIAASVNDLLLPSADLQGKIYGIANLSVCNNRFEPQNAAEMATQVLLGTPVEVLKKERGYYLVRSPDKYISWTDDAGVEAMDKAQFNKWQEAEKIVITTQYGHAFSEASENSMPVSDVVAGNIFRVLEKGRKFYKVAYPDNRIAYVPVKSASDYSKWVSKPNPDAYDILASAKQLVGIPYLWGGTSIKGLDCSGFTKTCYFLNGIVLPRDASQQVLYGEQVDIFENDTVNIAKALKNLKAGDLLFFANRKNKNPNPRVTHTAIYMGEGKFIQAAGLVRINSMKKGDPDYDDFQSRTFVNAKRMLTSIGTPEISRISEHPFYTTRKN